MGLHGVDDFVEAVWRERGGIEKLSGEFAQGFAGGVTRKSHVGFHLGENFLRVVVKNQGQQIFQCSAVGGLRTEQRRGTLAPGGLVGGEFGDLPGAFAENGHHIGSIEFIFDCGRGIMFGGGHWQSSRFDWIAQPRVAVLLKNYSELRVATTWQAMASPRPTASTPSLVF